MAATTRTEPDPAGQVCGDQIGHGLPHDLYCAEAKAPSEYFCGPHAAESREMDGDISLPGHARGR
jgi:hypothetical protein